MLQKASGAGDSVDVSGQPQIVVTKATIYVTEIPTARPHEMAIGTSRASENVIVALQSSDGVTGWGEAPHMVGHSQAGETPGTVRVVMEQRLIPAILGKSLTSLERVLADVDRSVPGNLRAKGAVVMAAYDLVARTYGIPVTLLLGGQYRDRVPLSWSLPIAPLDVTLAEAEDRVAAGWKILKVKAGRREVAEDVSLVYALREKFGHDVRLRVDANQAYDVKTAVRVLLELDSAELDFFEQPVSRFDVDGMRFLTQHPGHSIPIMVDEGGKSMEAFVRHCQTRAADCASVYIIGPGGIHVSKKMASILEGFGMPGYVGGALESAIGTAAGLHLAAASPSISLGCELFGPMLLEAGLTVNPPDFEGGALVVPTGPGLGIEVDMAALDRFASDTAVFDHTNSL